MAGLLTTIQNSSCPSKSSHSPLPYFLHLLPRTLQQLVLKHSQAPVGASQLIRHKRAQKGTNRAALFHKPCINGTPIYLLGNLYFIPIAGFDTDTTLSTVQGAEERSSSTHYLIGDAPGERQGGRLSGLGEGTYLGSGWWSIDEEILPGSGERGGLGP